MFNRDPRNNLNYNLKIMRRYITVHQAELNKYGFNITNTILNAPKGELIEWIEKSDQILRTSKFETDSSVINGFKSGVCHILRLNAVENLMKEPLVDVDCI